MTFSGYYIRWAVVPRPVTRTDTLAGVDTDRLETHYLEPGGSEHDAGETVHVLHGNVSSSRFFEDVLAALPGRHRAIAPDLRGYGDFAADLRSFVDELDLERPLVHVDWSNGGGGFEEVVFDNTGHTPHVEVPMDFPDRLESALEG
jgi:pimeloyl-ACP methyl ester carboxylesterase